MTFLNISFKKEDLFIYLGAIACLIGIYYGYTLILGIAGIICGLWSMKLKSKYWSWIIMGSVGVIILYFLRMFY